jgi:hypothetical protein
MARQSCYWISLQLPRPPPRRSAASPPPPPVPHGEGKPGVTAREKPARYADDLTARSGFRASPVTVTEAAGRRRP